MMTVKLGKKYEEAENEEILEGTELYDDELEYVAGGGPDKAKDVVRVHR